MLNICSLESNSSFKKEECLKYFHASIIYIEKKMFRKSQNLKWKELELKQIICGDLDFIFLRKIVLLLNNFDKLTTSTKALTQVFA